MADRGRIAASGSSINAETLQALRAGVRGEILRPGDAGFDTARRVWNGTIDKTPALIVRCTGASDVMRAIDFARTHDLLLAVHGGGHSVAGNGVCDGGLMLDLSPMKGIRVSPAHRAVRAAPGVTFGELDRENQAFGMITPGGVVSTTGIAGLTLGGGVGWLVRKHGLTCDNLLSADVVTADGRLLTASGTENADLFWALRGGGGNFGVVTSFEYRLHPLGPVMAGMVVHPRPKANDMLRFFREFTHNEPDELTTYAGLVTAPDGSPVAAMATCYSGPAERAEAAVGPLRSFGPPVADMIQAMPFTSMQTSLDAAFGPGHHYYWRSTFLEKLSDETIDTIVEQANRAPSPLSAVFLEYYGGAASRVPVHATAFPHRQPQYDLVVVAQWTEPSESERNAQWVRDLWQAVQPFMSRNVYVNFLGEEGEDRVRSAFGPNYDRLAALKTKYDPTNLFRLNQNIKPASAATEGRAR